MKIKVLIPIKISHYPINMEHDDDDQIFYIVRVDDDPTRRDLGDSRRL